MYELAPLTPTVYGYQDASGYMCRSVILTEPSTVPQVPQIQPSSDQPSQYPTSVHTNIWRSLFPSDVIKDIFSWETLQVNITNSDLELSEILLQQDWLTNFFYVQEIITNSLTDKIADLCLKKIWLDMCTSPPESLLRLQSPYQHQYHYTTCHYFVGDTDNEILDIPSRSTHIY